jgi:hypothetical protein
MLIYFDQNVKDNQIFLPSKTQLKRRFVCQDMTYEKLLKKNMGINLCKLKIFRRSILPIGSTKKSQTIPRCNSALKQQLHKVAAPDLPWLFN